MDISTINQNKGTPPLREWELDDNSNRYEKNLAAPSDSELVNYWWSWSILAFGAGLFTLIIFVGVVSSRQARQQSFNVYLIYLMIPDFTFSLLCGTTCLLNALKGRYWSHWMCNFQQWYCVWGIGSNCWLNALITYQLHTLLKSNQQGRRYFMPSPAQVSKQALAVYLYCAFLGTWGLIDQNHFPFYALQISGLACIPVEVNMPSALFFWLFFMPIFALIPTLYVIYVTVDISRNKLLPPTGKRRLLAIYFGRTVFIFLLLWGPYFLLNYLLATLVPTWVLFVGGIFSHLQGPLSAGVSLLKPDIWFAVKRFVTCRCCQGEQSDQGDSYYNQQNRFSTTTDESSGGGLVTWGSSTLMQRLQTSTKRLFGYQQQQQRRSSADNNDDDDNLEPVHEEEEQRLPSSLLPPPNSVSYSCVWPNEDGDYTSGDDEEEEEEEELAQQPGVQLERQQQQQQQQQQQPTTEGDIITNATDINGAS